LEENEWKKVGRLLSSHKWKMEMYIYIYVYVYIYIYIYIYREREREREENRQGGIKHYSRHKEKLGRGIESDI